MNIAGILGCAAAPPRPESGTSAPAAPAPRAPAPSPPATPDPDLHRPPPVRRLAIDWEKINLTSDADAMAVWAQIAPTGADWDDKLQEIPQAIAPRLAAAFLRDGNLTCVRPPASDCEKPAYEVPPPAETAGFADPCLRRLLALWSLGQLDDADVPGVWPQLLAIAAIPPPESQLLDAAVAALPEGDQDARLELLTAAWRAGQHDLVGSLVGGFDEAHLTEAVRRHIGGVLGILPPQTARPVLLAAIKDELLPASDRTTAMIDAAASGEVAVDALAPDLRAALLVAVTSRDCGVAAAAARMLAHHGDARFVPRRPDTRNTGPLMRAMCVLASYQALQRSDEASLLATYLPARGLERVTIAYDALSDTDSDGDGDPHTSRTEELVARDEAVLPEIDDLIRAMRHCTGTICVSDDREVRFAWKPFRGQLLLSRIEIADRPPCVAIRARP